MESELELVSVYDAELESIKYKRVRAQIRALCKECNKIVYIGTYITQIKFYICCHEVASLLESSFG